MTKGWLIVSALFVLIVVGTLILFIVPAPTVQAPTSGTATTTVETGTLTDFGIYATTTNDVSLTFNEGIASPWTLEGKARGTWFFEASAPYMLKDAAGKVIAQGHIEALSDWMTTNFVPFKTTITFPAQPAASHGTLVLMNDNPSGDPAKQKELDIPVQFK